MYAIVCIQVYEFKYRGKVDLAGDIVENVANWKIFKVINSNFLVNDSGE